METEADPGGPGDDSVDVTGTWTGTGGDQVTVSGGCGSGGGDSFTITTMLVQDGGTVTGTASAGEGTFTVQNGSVNGSTFTFSVATSDSACSQQSNQFTCQVQAASMSCLQTETHCDSCSGSYVTHTVQQSFAFSRK